MGEIGHFSEHDNWEGRTRDDVIESLSTPTLRMIRLRWPLETPVPTLPVLGEEPTISTSVVDIARVVRGEEVEGFGTGEYMVDDVEYRTVFFGGKLVAQHVVSESKALAREDRLAEKFDFVWLDDTTAVVTELSADGVGMGLVKLSSAQEIKSYSDLFEKKSLWMIYSLLNKNGRNTVEFVEFDGVGEKVRFSDQVSTKGTMIRRILEEIRGTVFDNTVSSAQFVDFGTGKKQISCGRCRFVGGRIVSEKLVFGRSREDIDSKRTADVVGLMNRGLDEGLVLEDKFVLNMSSRETVEGSFRGLPITGVTKGKISTPEGEVLYEQALLCESLVGSAVAVGLDSNGFVVKIFDNPGHYLFDPREE